MTTTLTANVTLTKKEFNARVVAFIGKCEISRYNAGEKTGSYRLTHTLADIQRYAKYNEEDGIPASYGFVAYGITWVIDSGRINGTTHIALKALTVRELIALVHELHTSCANMGEYARYLMAKYTVRA